MECNEFLPLLSGHIDRMNSEAEERRLQEHLRSCKHCRARLEQMEQADEALRNGKAAPPADLTARIMAQVRAQPRQKPSRKRTVLPIAAAGLASAAMLALVFFGVFSLPALQTGDTAYAQEEGVSFENKAVSGESAPEAANDGIYYDYMPNNAAVPNADAMESAVTSSEPLLAAEDAPGAASIELPAFTLPSVDFSTGGTESTPLVSEPTAAAGTLPSNSLLPDITPPGTDAPLLLIWNADPGDIAFFKGLTPLTSSSESELPTSQDAGTLYERLLAPLTQKISDAASALPSKPALTATKYLVSYEQLCALFTECIGTYEIAVYYPADVCDLEHCTVLVLTAIG